jgi:hypothetical protein
MSNDGRKNRRWQNLIFPGRNSTQVSAGLSDDEASQDMAVGSQKEPTGKTVFRPLIETPATWMLRKSNAPHGATHGKS